MIRWIVILCLCALPVSLRAQDDADNGLIYGGQITGQINRAQPRLVYYFDGLRGEVITIQLTATGGDLDPVFLLLDTDGRVVVQQDDGAENDTIQINALALPQTGRYYAVVGRFGFGLGSTVGSFSLTIERIGVSSESGSVLRYGDSVINNIDNLSPQLYYSFRAQQGDIIEIIMQRNSGNLDPYLQVVNSRGEVIADNDEQVGSGSLDAQVNNLVIEETGSYIVIASRYGQSAGTSSGRFILTLREAQNSGLGNAAQTAIRIVAGETVEGEIDDDAPIRFYAFNAVQDEIISIKMDRIGGTLDALVSIADANLQELSQDDDSGGGQNALLSSFRVPADGRYYILASRADRAAGTSSGSYRLQIQSLGNAFDGVPDWMQRIGYGTTITGRVDATTPEVLFAFRGETGDAVTISLNRGDGDLDPFLSLLDANGNTLAEDDDSGGGQNARILRFVIESSGVYYIRASRFSGTDGNPNTQGSFVLVLARIAR